MDKTRKKIYSHTNPFFFPFVGSSGKSTLFQQIDNIHGKGLRNNWDTIKKQIRMNLIESMIKLIQQSNALSKKYPECKINFEEKQTEQQLELLISHSKYNKSRDMSQLSTINDDELEDLGKAISFLWSLEGVQATYNLRQYYSLYENIDYFLNKAEEIMNTNYVEPSNEDALKCRIKTTGILEKQYKIEGQKMNLFDVGGQRNERRKWIQLFDGVDVVIFVAALNHYCCVLFEDETTNSMQESLALFDEIINAKWFKLSQMVLFLNKEDIFRQRLKEGISLKVCFGDKWNGSDYNRKAKGEEGKNYFRECYTDALNFILEQYESRNKNLRMDNKIYVHVTNATSKNNVEKVFRDVQTSIIQNSLVGSGFAFA